MLRELAVNHIKPWLSDEAWLRLRRLSPSAVSQDAARQAQRAERAERAAQAAEQRATRAEGRADAAQAALRQLQGLDRMQFGGETNLSEESLTALARHFRTDKWGRRHRYTPHYERHLGHLKNERFTLLEIGIGGYRRDQEGGASLRMWQEYFPRAQIFGLDIEDKSFVDGERITTYQGSQTDEAVLGKIVEDAENLQVIIDDGSHRSKHTRRTFEILLPALPIGGVYAIEDLQTSYWERYGGSRDLNADDTSMAMIKSLLDDLNYEEYTDVEYQPTQNQAYVVGVHAYHNLVFIDKGLNNEGLGIPRANHN